MENKCQDQGTVPVIHSNDPYIPWTPETRRQVLHSFVGHSPDLNANTYGYPRTALQLAPTSSRIGNQPSGALFKRMKLSANLKNLTSLVSKNLKQVAKRMSKYKDATPTLDSSELSFSSYCLSSNSFEPKDAITLSAWLSDRQHKQFEYEKTSPTGMTLEEYEEWGSWTHLSQSASMKVDDIEALDGLPSPRKSRSELFLKSQPQSVMHSPRVASSDLNRSSLRGTLSAHDRAMPGGWTFG